MIKKNENIDKILETLRPLNLKEIYDTLVNDNLPKIFLNIIKPKKKKVKSGLENVVLRNFRNLLRNKFKTSIKRMKL